MTTPETTSYRVEDATSPLWFGRWPSGWGDVVHGLGRGNIDWLVGVLRSTAATAIQERALAVLFDMLPAHVELTFMEKI